MLAVFVAFPLVAAAPAAAETVSVRPVDVVTSGSVQVPASPARHLGERTTAFEASSEARPLKRKRTSIFGKIIKFFLILVLVIIALIALGVFLLLQRRKRNRPSDNPPQSPTGSAPQQPGDTGTWPAQQPPPDQRGTQPDSGGDSGKWSPEPWGQPPGSPPSDAPKPPDPKQPPEAGGWSPPGWGNPPDKQ